MKKRSKSIEYLEDELFEKLKCDVEVVRTTRFSSALQKDVVLKYEIRFQLPNKPERKVVLKVDSFFQAKAILNTLNSLVDIQMIGPGKEVT